MGTAEVPCGPLLLGTLVLIILSWIPFVGWLVYLVATIFGLGSIWLQITGRTKSVVQ